MELHIEGLALQSRGGDPAGPLLQIEDVRFDGSDSSVLMGPSGSGKTSLLRVLAGIDLPLRGRLTWDGVDVGQLGAAQRAHMRRRHIGLVPQDLGLIAGMTALQSTLLPLRFDSFRTDREALPRAHALLERLSIPASVPVDRLSRGERQRVAIARAMLRKPGALLADEPTASLDPDSADAAMLALIEGAADVGAALIVATHDARMAAMFGRRLDLVDRTLREAG